MKAVKALVGVAALVLVSAASTAGAVAHPRLSSVNVLAHDVVTQAAGKIRLDRPAGSSNDGRKKCPRACGNRNHNAPSN